MTPPLRDGGASWRALPHAPRSDRGVPRVGGLMAAAPSGRPDPLLAEIAAYEAALPPATVAEAKAECALSRVLPTRYELVAYAAELRRAWDGLEADRRLAIYRTQGIAAYRADIRRPRPA